MMPINQIHEGDIFARKWPYTCTWVVSEVNIKEKMVLVQMFGSDLEPYGKPVWLPSKNNLFSLSNKQYDGLTYKIC